MYTYKDFCISLATFRFFAPGLNFDKSLLRSTQTPRWFRTLAALEKISLLEIGNNPEIRQYNEFTEQYFFVFRAFIFWKKQVKTTNGRNKVENIDIAIIITVLFTGSSVPVKLKATVS